MCGICGFNFEDKSLLERMTSLLEHRGPDDKGYYTDEGISLGHRRLSIIDLDSGRQPIYNEDESIVIIFNGEIYNYKELRKKLEKKHKFSTNTDTEVIIHSYEEYGEKCLEKFNGMFAFAIYDSNKKKLFVARDRTGEKPLYYLWHDGHLIFSSEMKSILLFKEYKKDIDPNSVSSLFTFRYMLSEQTMLKNIKKLLPGHYLTFQKDELKITRYNSFEFSKETKGDLLELLKDSVKLRLECDVPLGVFLSGGIDSSAIVALMDQLDVKDIKTFSLGFEHAKNNEFNYAKKIADKFSCDHEEILISPEEIRIIPKVIWHMDEPLSDPTSIPTYILSKYAAQKVKVILSGEGADELFMGYEQYKILKLAKIYSKLVPDFANNIVIKLIGLFPKDTFLLKLKQFISELKDDPKSYMQLISILNHYEKKIYFNEETLKNINLGQDISYVKQDFKNLNSILKKIQMFELNQWLPNDLLLKLDKMTMANSIEGRVPFLDHRIIDYSLSIPDNSKLDGFNEKAVLRHAMKPYLPREILNRKKQRFPLPTDSWFRHELRDYSKNVIEESNSGLFNKDKIQDLLGYQKKLSYKFLKINPLTRLYYSRQVWTFMTFELWYKTFIEREDIRKPLNNKLI